MPTMAEASVVKLATENGAVGQQSGPPQRILVGVVMPLASQQGGAEALLLHFLRQHQPECDYSCVFLQDGPLVGEVQRLGYDTTVIPTTHLSRPSNYVQTIFALRKWIRAKNLRIVVSWMPKAHLYVSLASRLLPTKAIWFQHGVPYGHFMDRLITLFPAEAILCCSKTSKHGQDLMFPKRQSHVCYPGVAFPLTDLKTQEQARTLLNLPLDVPIIGMVARLEHWKGAHIFVEAAGAILECYPNATMFILGGEHPHDKPYAERVHAMVEKLDRGNHLLLAGQRQLTEVPLWQAAADVIVHPAVGVEPFGMAIVEAMALGKVVVASNVGGPAETIQSGVTGILIDRGDPGLLASTVIRLLEDRDLLSKIGKQAAIRARDFSAEVFASRFNLLMTGLSHS